MSAIITILLSVAIASMLIQLFIIGTDDCY